MAARSKSKFKPIGQIGSRNARQKRSFQSIARDKVAVKDATVAALQKKKALELKQLQMKQFQVFAQQQRDKTAPARAASLAKRARTKAANQRRAEMLQRRKKEFETRKRKAGHVQDRKAARATGKTIDRGKIGEKIQLKQREAEAVARIKAGLKRTQQQKDLADRLKRQGEQLQKDAKAARKRAHVQRRRNARATGKTINRGAIQAKINKKNAGDPVYRAKQSANNYNPIPSAVVAEHGYDKRTQLLWVEFNGGAEYIYFDVPRAIFLEFIGGAEFCRTEGENEYGAWYVGKQPSLGAYLYWDIYQAGYAYQRIA